MEQVISSQAKPQSGGRSQNHPEPEAASATLRAQKAKATLKE